MKGYKCLLFVCFFSIMLVANAANPPYKQRPSTKSRLTYQSLLLTLNSARCDERGDEFTDFQPNDERPKYYHLHNQLIRQLEQCDDFLPAVTTVASNNLTPFLNQVLAKNAQMAANGKGVTAQTESMYMMMNQFATVTRVGTILQRVKSNSMTPGNWTLFNKCLGTVIFFSRYNLV